MTASAAPQPIRAVSFDLDGTLYATGAHRTRLLLRLLPQLRVVRAWRATLDELRAERHPDLDQALTRGVAERLGISRERAAERLHKLLEQTWAPALRPKHVLPGLHDALAVLDARGIPRAVASDLAAEHKLQRLGLAEGWQVVLDATSLGALKPWPDLLQATAQALGCPAAQLLHVGDRDDTDGEAARRAGARYLDVHDQDGSTATLPARLAAMLDAPGGAGRQEVPE